MEPTVSSIPLDGASPGPQSLSLLAVIAVATVGATVLLGLAVGAFVRRGSRSHLLIAGAVAALLARCLVAGIAALGALSSTGHHLLEHGLDVVLVALVIAAVYHARTPPRETGSKP